MEEVRKSEVHPFEQFKATMRKLVKVSKAELDAKLKEHNETKPERRAGRKRRPNGSPIYHAEALRCQGIFSIDSHSHRRDFY
jgi:hypothetical protein